MYPEQKPLYALTIGEFVELAKILVNEVLNERAEQGKKMGDGLQDGTEHFDIEELAAFLHCSKVSVHNYKRKGLPYYRIGRKILFKKQEVLDFMKKLKGKRIAA